MKAALGLVRIFRYTKNGHFRRNSHNVDNFFICQKIIFSSDETFFEHNSDLIILKFKYDYVYPQIKRKYFTVIDWFSFVGGILGLFFGFSFLSIFEIAFHSWMVFVNVRKKIVENDGWMSAKRNQSKTCGEFLRQFFGISTIHGLKYISDGNMRIAER